MSLMKIPPPHRAGFTREMHERFLVRPPSDRGMPPAPVATPVYGVVMEWPSEGETLTLTAFHDGAASVYGSRGDGIVGGGTDGALRSEARALVRAAAEHHGEAVPTNRFPDPAADRVRFYLLTHAGVRVLEAGLPSPNGMPDRYTSLYYRGMTVFEQLLIITGQHPDPEGESGGPRTARSAAEAYVHCLLTSMTLWVGGPVVVSASAPVPNLVERVAGVVDLEDWLAAEAFTYDAMDARQVIRALRGAAGIHGLPFFTRRGEYHILYETDGGDVVPCVFDIEIAPFERSATVSLAPAADPRVASLRRTRREPRKAGGTAST